MIHKLQNIEIQGAIFDVDGTILDTMPIWHNAGARFLKTLGIQAEEGLGDRLFRETSISGAQYLIDNYGLSLSVTQIAEGIDKEVEHYYFTEANFKKGAKELLEKMYQAEIPMTVATSTHRRPIEAALKRLGIYDWFREIYTCRDLETTKQEAMIFHTAKDVMKTDIDKTWVMEDGLYAIKTAKAAGYITMGVYDEVSKKDQNEIKRIADVYCESLEELEFR